METLTVVKENKITKIAEDINNGIEVFNEQKNALKQLAEEASSMTIESIDDKEGYKALVAMRKELKSNRVKIKNDGKAMRDPLTGISKFIIEKEKELIDIIEPVEKDLKYKEDWYNAEIERIKEEERKAEEAKINERVNSLAELGFKIDLGELKIMTDEEYEELLSVAKEQHLEEQERIKKEAEEAERQRLVMEAENRRLEEERKAKLEEERKAMEAERKAIEEAKAKLEAERLAKEKLEAESRAKAEEERRKFEEEKRAFEDAKRKAEEEVKAKEEAERLAKEKAEQEAKAKAEAERLEKERLAEIERMKPDYEKLVSYMAEIKSIEVPEVKTDKAKVWMEKFESIVNVANESLDQLKK